MLRPVKCNQGRLNQMQPLSGPDTQIIMGAASITLQNWGASPLGGPADTSRSLIPCMLGRFFQLAVGESWEEDHFSSRHTLPTQPQAIAAGLPPSPVQHTGPPWRRGQAKPTGPVARRTRRSVVHPMPRGTPSHLQCRGPALGTRASVAKSAMQAWKQERSLRPPRR